MANELGVRFMEAFFDLARYRLYLLIAPCIIQLSGLCRNIKKQLLDTQQAQQTRQRETDWIRLCLQKAAHQVDVVDNMYGFFGWYC